jgi:hypothetical protein
VKAPDPLDRARGRNIFCEFYNLPSNENLRGDFRCIRRLRRVGSSNCSATLYNRLQVPIIN